MQGAVLCFFFVFPALCSHVVEQNRIFLCFNETNLEGNLEYVLEVVTSLQKYVESSNIGEFEERVGLLAVFYRHLVMRGRNKGKQCVLFQTFFAVTTWLSSRFTTMSNRTCLKNYRK